MAVDGIKVEGEGEGSSMNPQLVEEKQVEKARTKGWRPVDEFKGDPADWVPAKEFLGREKLFEKIHDLKNQVSRQAAQFQKENAQMSAHFAKVRETEYKRALSDLKGQLAEAKAEGAVEDVAKIAGEIKEVEADARSAAAEAKVAQQAVRTGGPTPEFEAWHKENKWFQEDAEMTADAIAFGTGYSAANPNKTQTEVLAYVSKRIRKVYDEKFEDEPSTNKGNKRMEDKVEGSSGNRPAAKKKGELGVEDLTDMQRSIMRTLVKRGVLKEAAAKNKRTQEAEYLAQLAEREAA